MLEKNRLPTTAFAASPKDTSNLIGAGGHRALIVKFAGTTQARASYWLKTKKAAESADRMRSRAQGELSGAGFRQEAAGAGLCAAFVGRRPKSLPAMSARRGWRLPRPPAPRRTRRLSRASPSLNARPSLRARGLWVWAKRSVDCYRSGQRAQVLRQTARPDSKESRKHRPKDIVLHLIYDMDRSAGKAAACAQAQRIDQTIDHGAVLWTVLDAIPI